MKNKDHITHVIEENNLFREIHRKDLVSCYKLIGRLAEEIADTFRNPLTTVQGILQLVNHNELNFNKNLINIAIHEIQVIDTNITYLLNLSENKRIELEKVNINDIITDTVDELKKKVNIDQHNIILQLDPHLSTLSLDKKDIRQFLISAIHNGFEAMSMNGVLEIKTSEENSFVVVEVIDNGEGIPTNNLKSVYEPFYTTKPDHIGLGLAIIQTILWRNGGELDIQSILGKGTILRARFIKSRKG